METEGGGHLVPAEARGEQSTEEKKGRRTKYVIVRRTQYTVIKTQKWTG